MNRCFDCRFFNPIDNDLPGTGECRVNAPVGSNPAYSHFADQNIGAFPKTQHSDWCGQFESAGPAEWSCNKCKSLYREKDAKIVDRQVICPLCDQVLSRISDPAMRFECECGGAAITFGPEYLEDCPNCGKCGRSMKAVGGVNES